MNDDRSSHCEQMNWSPAFRKLTNADGRKPVTAVSSLGFGPSSVGRSSGGWRPADGQLTAGGRWLPARAPPAARPFHGKWRLNCGKRKKELCWRNCQLHFSIFIHPLEPFDRLDSSDNVTGLCFLCFRQLSIIWLCIDSCKNFIHWC